MDPITNPPRLSILRCTLLLALLLGLGACRPFSSPIPSPTPAAAQPVAPRPTTTAVHRAAATATPAAKPIALTLPLPAGWSPVVVPSHAWESPTLRAVGPDGAQLTGTLIPRRGLTLAQFVEETARALSLRQLNVKRSEVVFDVRPDGVPVGVLEYGAGEDAEGIQWSMVTEDAQSILTVTLVTSPDQTIALRAALGDVLATLDRDDVLE